MFQPHQYSSGPISPGSPDASELRRQRELLIAIELACPSMPRTIADRVAALLSCADARIGHDLRADLASFLARALEEAGYARLATVVWEQGAPRPAAAA